MAPRPLDRLRRICLALPGAFETVSHGAATFWGGKRVFAMFSHAETHHGRGRHGVWFKAAPGNQELMIRADPHRYFSPPYVGPGGWIGVYLDTGVEWKAVADLAHDAWRLVAPKKLLATPAPARPRSASAAARQSSRRSRGS